MPSIVPISGMVKIAPNEFLCISDAKNRAGTDLDNQDWLYRCCVFDADTKACTDVRISSWPRSTPRPSDFEAICAVTDRAGEFLLLESGFYRDNFGRAVHVRAVRGNGGWTLSYLGHFEPFAAGPAPYSTPKAEQIEGAAMVQGENDVRLLVLATRGSETTSAELRWLSLDPDGSTFELGTLSGSAVLADLGSQLANRGAASLRLVPEENDWRVWSVATYDPHDDGPFRSIIYAAGLLEWDGVGAPNYVDVNSISVLWTIEGLKVEALASPADGIANSVLSIAADDEDYGGVWRPLAAYEKPKTVTREVIAAGDFSLFTLQ